MLSVGVLTNLNGGKTVTCEVTGRWCLYQNGCSFPLVGAKSSKAVKCFHVSKKTVNFSHGRPVHMTHFDTSCSLLLERNHMRRFFISLFIYPLSKAYSKIHFRGLQYFSVTLCLCGWRIPTDRKRLGVHAATEHLAPPLNQSGQSD